MSRFKAALLLTVLLPVALADVFTLSLGNLDQYSTSIANVPTLTGSKILFTSSADPNDGLDIVLSDELRKDLQTAVENDCKDVNESCIQSVNGILTSPHTELEIGGLSSEAALGASYLTSDLLSYIIGGMMEKSPADSLSAVWHAPASQILQASSAATASVVAIVTNTSTPFVVVTPQPILATVTGSQPPSITTYTDSRNGHSAGDVDINLSEDLALQLTELFMDNSDCTDGKIFDTHGKAIAIGRLHKRLDNLGAVVCAAEAGIRNAGPGGPFGDLAALGGNPLAWANPEGIRALGVVRDFARRYAPNLGMNPGRAEGLADPVFALADRVFGDGEALKKQNRIKSDKLEVTMTPSRTPSRTPSGTKTTSSSSSSSSSSVEGCIASCAMTGIIKQCETDCPTHTSGSGPKPTAYEVTTVIITPWTPPVKKAPVETIGCLDPTSHFPRSLFATQNIYANFCKSAEETPDNLSWLVDIMGQELAVPGRTLRSRAVPRDPPPDADKWKDYTFQIYSWPNNSTGQVCSETCSQAFNKLAYSECGKEGDEQDEMATQGNIDIGCGEYGYQVIPPPIKPQVTCRNHPLSAPQHDSDAQGAVGVESAIEKFCSENDGKAEIDVSERYGITELGIADRSSYWLRASLSDGCSGAQKIVKDECTTALKDGMQQCDSQSTVTHGVRSKVGCLDYSIDLGGAATPPWAEVHEWPAPEFLPGKGLGGAANVPISYPAGSGLGRPLSNDDLESAIGAFCQDGQEIKGYGKYWENMYRYPFKGTPQFYPGDSLTMHVNLGAETINNGAADPYDDMNWCHGYDWKLGKDDCTYAFRRLLAATNTIQDKFQGGTYIYRCVGYKIYHTNCDRKDSSC